MSEAKPFWGHAQTITYRHGKAKVSCRCGKQSPRGTDQEAADWIEEHRRSYRPAESKPVRRLV